MSIERQQCRNSIVSLTRTRYDRLSSLIIVKWNWTKPLALWITNINKVVNRLDHSLNSEPLFFLLFFSCFIRSMTIWKTSLINLFTSLYLLDKIHTAFYIMQNKEMPISMMFQACCRHFLDAIPISRLKQCSYVLLPIITKLSNSMCAFLDQF